MAMRWTDEMHATFLDRMEASFVERMLMSHGGGWCGGVEDDHGSQPWSFLAGRRSDGPPSPSSECSEAMSSLTTERTRLPDDGAESTSLDHRKRSKRRVHRESSDHSRARGGAKSKKTSSQRCNDLTKDLDQVVPVLEVRNSVAAAIVEKEKVDDTNCSSQSFAMDLKNEKESEASN